MLTLSVSIFYIACEESGTKCQNGVLCIKKRKVGGPDDEAF